MKQHLLVSFLALSLAACAAANDDTSPNAEPRAKTKTTEQAAAESNAVTTPAELNADSASLWLPSATDGFTYIPVCWETAGDADLKNAVRNAVYDTWEHAARIKFEGWGDCAGDSDGIRISIKDETPHTSGLGRSLAGEDAGMVLNFTFMEWDSEDEDGNPVDFCKLEENKQWCVEGIAVHEFGHALGFPHEQNRPDVPTQKCKDERQGSNGDTALGAFDWDSIMNYCNPRWNNGGRLSDSDKEQVANLYGSVAQVNDPSWACFIPPCPMVPGNVDGGDGLLHYGDVVAIGDATGHYLRMDDDEDIRSNVDHFKDEERWVLVNPDNPGDRGSLAYGARVSLQGQTGAYMTARDDFSVRSWGLIGGEWEIWTLVKPGNVTSGDLVDVTDPVVFYSAQVNGYVYHDFGNPRLTQNIGYGEVWYMRGPL